MLKFSTSCFFPLAPPPTFGILVADCRLNSKEATKKRQSLRCTRCRIHLKWGKNGWAGGKEQDVPFLWQPSDAESMGLHCTRCKTASATRSVHSRATRSVHSTAQHGRTQSQKHSTRKLCFKRQRAAAHSTAAVPTDYTQHNPLYSCVATVHSSTHSTVVSCVALKDAVAWKQEKCQLQICKWIAFNFFL